MIVRILGEGQWVLDDEAVAALNGVDDAVEKAVQASNQDDLTAALHALHDQVRQAGTVVPDDDLLDSDLILPSTDSSLAEVKALLEEAEDGLIPG